MIEAEWAQKRRGEGTQAMGLSGKGWLMGEEREEQRGRSAGQERKRKGQQMVRRKKVQHWMVRTWRQRRKRGRGHVVVRRLVQCRRRELARSQQIQISASPAWETESVIDLCLDHGQSDINGLLLADQLHNALGGGVAVLVSGGVDVGGHLDLAAGVGADEVDDVATLADHAADVVVGDSELTADGVGGVVGGGKSGLELGVGGGCVY